MQGTQNTIVKHHTFSVFFLFFYQSKRGFNFQSTVLSIFVLISSREGHSGQVSQIPAAHFF